MAVCNISFRKSNFNAQWVFLATCSCVLLFCFCFCFVFSCHVLFVGLFLGEAVWRRGEMERAGGEGEEGEEGGKKGVTMNK